VAEIALPPLEQVTLPACRAGRRRSGSASRTSRGRADCRGRVAGARARRGRVPRCSPAWAGELAVLDEIHVVLA
jgi:hypothetical protein